METVIQVLFAVVVIVASVWSEMNKHSGSSTTTSKSDFPDLDSIEEFFRNQGKPTPPPTTPAPRQTSEWQEPTGIHAQEAPRDDLFLPPAEGAFAPPPKKPKKPRKRDKMITPGEKGGALGRHQPKSQTPSHASAEGACLDEGAALEGQVNYERDGVKIERSTMAPLPSSQHLRHIHWTRQQMIDGILLSELLQRYDPHRVFRLLHRNTPPR